jgi:hypothetical protein
LREENEKLKVALKSRTEEANATILKLAEEAKDKTQKADEYLQLIEQLSNEILKS